MTIYCLDLIQILFEEFRFVIKRGIKRGINEVNINAPNEFC